MIQANELRIGNLVFIGAVDKQLHEIEAIITDPVSDDEIFVKGIDYDYHLHIEPIPLTPEVLEKIKQVEKEWHNHYSVKNGECSFTIEFNITGTCVNITPGGMCDQTMGIDINCEMLHQLQNLFFALTGEELLIDLTTLQ